MVFDFEDGRLQRGEGRRGVDDFVITEFGHPGNRVVAKKGVAESDRPRLVVEVRELVIRAVGEVAFCGQGEGLTLVCAVGVAGGGLREHRLTGKNDGYKIAHQASKKGRKSVHDIFLKK